MMKIYQDEPKDTWSVSRGRFLGKELLQDLRTIFTRNDPFGNVANILDALQEAIDQRSGIRFGYRSGTKGKYQNPFKNRDAAIYGWEVSGFSQGRPTLKVLGYDQAVVRSNIQVLVEKGYIKDPKQFMLELEQQGQRALEDPEGRINPEGRDENTLMTVAFGLKESAPNIKSEGLRNLLESKAIKKSFRSYDVEALAGLTKGRDKAFAFEYSNIRDNYNPFKQMDENMYLPVDTGGPASVFRQRLPKDKISGNWRTFKNPVKLRDGARLSGVADNDTQDTFYGYDKNGQLFTIRREYVQPDQIVGSRDSDRTAKIIRRELREGTMLVPEMTDKNLYLPTEESNLEFQISTRNPTARNRTENPVSSNLVITLNDILETPGVAESHAKAVNRYPGFKASRAKPETVIGKFVDMVESNLLHLYDSVDPEIRERSKLWYVGARKIALEYAEKYGFSPQAVAATMAATSPQTDWYKNVDRTRRILDTVKNEQDTVFTEEMGKKTISTASKTDKPIISAIVQTMIGKPFKELNQKEQAYFIRSHDELNRDRTYQIISPEGDFVGPARKDNGEIDKYSWLSYNQITKALSALADDSKANISNVMGEAHKIRNFYNNILLPFLDKQAVTIDTHAVAAGLLRPLASKDLEVANMLGAKPTGKGFVSIKNSSVAGISGLYGIYAEAYRRAAKARGVLPREMQSITWEAIRGLYPKEIKQPKFKQQINDLFKAYENGKISIDDLRSKIFDKAGGIDPPSWAEGNNPTGENRPRGSRNPQGGKASSDEGKLFRPSVRGFGTRDRPRGVRTTPARTTPSGVNRFIATAARTAVTSVELDRFGERV